MEGADAPVLRLRRYGAFCKVVLESELSPEAKEARRTLLTSSFDFLGSEVETRVWAVR